MQALSPKTIRLDALLVERGLADSQDRAQALIAAGMIEVDGKPATSAAQGVTPDGVVNLRQSSPWASRGGEKLSAALDEFGVAVQGRVCLDAGASTGGFTDVLLSCGAARVYTVDVGRGLLLPRVAEDARVVVMDQTNLRTLESVDGPAPDLITLDLSFISLRSVLDALLQLAPGAEVVALFKPQFEMPRDKVPAGGVVTDEAEIKNYLSEFLRWAMFEKGAVSLHDPVPSAVRGAKGNQEWFVHLRLPEDDD